MLALGIRYLTGRAVATSVDNRDAVEWPPHPARVFMAMAAAHFETDRDPVEQEALGWLESQSSPALRASGAEPRSVTTHFVPVNDRVTVSKSALQSAPGLTRNRAARTFPSVRPDADTVHLIWNADVSTERKRALDKLCGKVTRIGHSSSLVQMWVEEDASEIVPTLVPNPSRPDRRLRTTTAGLLGELEREYPDRRPTVSTSTPYGPPTDARRVSSPVFDARMVVLRLEPAESGPGRLGLEMTARLTHALRGALLHHAEEPIPEYLSGHRPDGSPSGRTHLAWVPLVDVGHRHADGHILGVAAVLPDALAREERRECVRTLARIDTLLLGRLGRWRLVPEEREAPPQALRPEIWTSGPDGRPAAAWASVTPVVFDRFSEDPEEKREIIADSCERIGLPRPAAVRLTGVSTHLGVPHGAQFPPLPASGGGPRRPYTHVILTFPEPVSGPVLIGAGRYRGYGLLRPYRKKVSE